MGKKRKDTNEISKILQEGDKIVIKDGKSDTKAFVPVQIGQQTVAELVNVDGGLITGLSQNELICDNLLYTLESPSTIGNITWFIELKGTKNEKEVRHAIEQIFETVGYFLDRSAFPMASKYIEKRDYIFAAVADAPDKTLPRLIDPSVRKLCKQLYKLSGKRRNIEDMAVLFFYIKPNKNCKKMKLQQNTPPYEIICYSTSEGYITFPEDLLEMLFMSRI